MIQVCPVKTSTNLYNIGDHVSQMKVDYFLGTHFLLSLVEGCNTKTVGNHLLFGYYPLEKKSFKRHGGKKGRKREREREREREERKL
jgi:hypothetical protein